METTRLKRFAAYARRSLMEQVSNRLKLVLSENSAARRERPETLKELERALNQTDKEQLVERVAYIWFNRFCALRFMDVNRYTRIGVVSPATGQFQPEILAEAKMGHIDEELADVKIREKIIGLLNDKIPSSDPQTEAYRLLIVAACNAQHQVMPYLFERINDYTELLMPDDLLSGNSILAYTREAMTPDVCQDVEVIGWLYQFYISEKKDEVFDGLKKNKKITPENIPAATQLFTPHWIVRYLVENSLGRLWMLNRPNSKLVEQMEYYIPVVSDQWPVTSKEGVNHGEKLQGSDCLAKGDGFSRRSVSTQQSVSEGGNLRTDQSDSESSGLGSIKHSGGPGSSVESRISQFSLDSSGVTGGSGNSATPSDTYQISIGTTNAKSTFITGGSQQDAGISQGEISDQPPVIREQLSVGSDQGSVNSSAGHLPLETDYLRISSPEEIRICDPACGSGHMLTYAFDLLYAIYEESGYEPNEIPEKILTHNLYGIEIDERAGELAAFALTMKARAKQRRFFRNPVQPNICVLENITLGEDTLKNYARVFGKELFTDSVIETLQQFREAKNFGSLIIPKASNVSKTLAALKNLKERSLAKMGSSDELSQEQLLLVSTANFDAICKALQQADYLSPKYPVVIANPPYMGGKGMNVRMAEWLKENYSDVKSDLFSAFIVRNSEIVLPKGQLGFMTPFVWMFISSYEKLRSFIIENKTITSLIQLEYSGFDGATVPICTFTLENYHRPNYKGGYVRLSDFRGSENQSPKTLEAIKNPNCGWFYRASAADFSKIPGSPIAYWASNQQRTAFRDGRLLSEIATPRQGIATANNERFLRRWHEVSFNDIHFELENQQQATQRCAKWLPYNKGGNFRKWYGNNDFVINWKEDGREIRNFCDENGKQRSAIRNPTYFFRPSVTWTDISSTSFGVRKSEQGFLFDGSSHSAFPQLSDLNLIVGLLSSKTTFEFLKIINPTMHFQVGNVASIPIIEAKVEKHRNQIQEIVSALVSNVKSDWDFYETSWDFRSLQLLNSDYYQLNLKASYYTLRTNWQSITIQMQCLEEENNRIFIEAYGLQDELTPEVPFKEITLTCNPHYRYGGDKSEAELEALLLADTMKEFISYAVGCMFGRYALEKPGLILANQGETVADFIRKVTSDQGPVTSKEDSLATDHLPLTTKSGFQPDADNVIPILDGDWFTDDITEQFRKFLRLTFGEEHYAENLKFIEDAIGKDLRKYFLKDFYTDHVKRYKKRPIYWLFSSPKGSFNALIYMHRYQPDTVSIVLNDYLREFRTKLSAQLEHLKRVEASTEATKAEKTKALKEIENLRKTIDELDTWEREVMYPLATEKIAIDLDDGVKHNYTLFGAALKKIPGLDAKDED